MFRRSLAKRKPNLLSGGFGRGGRFLWLHFLRLGLGLGFTQCEAIICFQEIGKLGPAAGLLKLEDVKIKGDVFSRVLFKEPIDCGLELLGFQFVRQIFGGAFVIVLDSEIVEKRLQHFLLRLEQPDLEKMFRNAVAGAQLAAVAHPLDLLNNGFALDEHRTQPFFLGDGNEDALVNIAVIFPQILEYRGSEFWRKGLENLVGFHAVLVMPLLAYFTPTVNPPECVCGKNLADFVSNLAKYLHFLFVGAFRVGGINKRPVIAIDLAGKLRACLIGISTNRNDGFHVSVEKLVHVLGRATGDVDPNFLHRDDRRGVDIATGGRPGARNFQTITGSFTEETFSHLGAAGIPGAENENEWF
tara:strand:+ start:32564 stop:33634 length:1071 start_codon:yes stop_codon:yes gene_type:complete